MGRKESDQTKPPFSCPFCLQNLALLKTWLSNLVKQFSMKLRLSPVSTVQRSFRTNWYFHLNFFLLFCFCPFDFFNHQCSLWSHCNWHQGFFKCNLPLKYCLFLMTHWFLTARHIFRWLLTAARLYRSSLCYLISTHNAGISILTTNIGFFAWSWFSFRKKYVKLFG